MSPLALRRGVSNNSNISHSVSDFLYALKTLRRRGNTLYFVRFVYMYISTRGHTAVASEAITPDHRSLFRL